eukprot:1079147-Rhodomonas_salina.1
MDVPFNRVSATIQVLVLAVVGAVAGAGADAGARARVLVPVLALGAGAGVDAGVLALVRWCLLGWCVCCWRMCRSWSWSWQSITAIVDYQQVFHHTLPSLCCLQCFVFDPMTLAPSLPEVFRLCYDLFTLLEQVIFVEVEVHQRIRT